MELKHKAEKLVGFLKKYKFVALILLLGLVFMLIPNTRSADTKVPQTNTSIEKEEITFEEKLAEILNQIDGAGKVRVMLTISEGEEIVFQTDEDLSTGSDTSDRKIDTVTVTDAQKNQSGLIRKVNPPVYRGAIIVCQGADDPVVKLAVTEAVARITGIGTNCISVLKMK